MLEPTRLVTTEPNDTYPLIVTAKCYRPHSPGGDSTTGLTFVLLHSVGSHKESWEPTIAELFTISSACAKDRIADLSIREVWSVECPTHGRSAVLNEKILRQPEWDGKCGHQSIFRIRPQLIHSTHLASLSGRIRQSGLFTSHDCGSQRCQYQLPT